jgi:hypothetical protein
MRLWSLDPAHLDARGLVALWREALLARAVLRGRTRGYKHHPQLTRFRAHPQPVAAINSYLAIVWREADRRGYRFDVRKLRGVLTSRRIGVTGGQLEYEWLHLLKKLRRRAALHDRSQRSGRPQPHPLFRLRRGPVEGWESFPIKTSRRQ